jgi:hypothetical protein
LKSGAFLEALEARRNNATLKARKSQMMFISQECDSKMLGFTRTANSIITTLF